MLLSCTCVPLVALLVELANWVRLSAGPTPAWARHTP